MDTILRGKFAEALKNLELEVLKMGEVVEKMLAQAMVVLNTRDQKLADTVIAMDDEVDRYNLEIEKKCIELIARQQPMGKDLRVIASTMRIITDVERMGDYTVDVTKFIKRLIEAGASLGSCALIPKMAEVTSRMLHETLQAYESKDLNLVQKMIEDDDIVDNFFKELFSVVLAEIQENPQAAASSIHVLMMGRYLERIADHVTNVGERVYYTETGELKELHQ